MAYAHTKKATSSRQWRDQDHTFPKFRESASKKLWFNELTSQKSWLIVAVDEASHASFGWRTVVWILGRQCKSRSHLSELTDW